ncbi:MAG TPA: 23S rRNA (uracil(1939)-C(5))-methyltransferase RlmD [Kofleriaceae bacterium]
MSKCQVTATWLDEAGHGVGTADGRRVHVADLLPGECAEVAIDHTSPHKPEAWGRVVRRLGTASADRVEPACPGFGRCGGCLWQHLAYPAQLAAKRARVVAALGEDAAVADVRPSPQLLGYRNKGKYVVGRLRTALGESIVLGAYAPRSHHVIDTIGCRVVAPIIDEVATWVRGAAERAQLVPYDEKARTGELRYIVVREAAGDVMIALIVATAAERIKLERVANALAKHPAVRGLVAITNDRRDGAIVPSGSSAQVLFGHGHLVEELAGVTLEVGASEFLQVNRAQAQAMYARVAELAGDLRGKHAVDLFAGLGGFGLHLARAGATVVAVEIDRDAVAQLRRAAEHANLPLTAIAGDATAALIEELGEPDVVVVNPPRKGLSEATRDLLAALAPPMIIYVSCGPDSLGRDLAALRVHGYSPDAIEPFDLMPGTAQVETIVRLRK